MQISETLETTFSERVYFQKSLLFRGGGGGFCVSKWVGLDKKGDSLKHSDKSQKQLTLSLENQLLPKFNNDIKFPYMSRSRHVFPCSKGQ